MKHTYILLFTLFVSTISFAQSASSYAVLVEAKAIQNPVSVLLTWNLDANASTYTVYRRLPHEPTFGTAVATLSGTDTSYTDTNVELNKEYEYQVKKTANGYSGFGYCNAGVEVLMEDDKGFALLLVESNLYAQLTDNLDQALEDLRADGWRAELMDVTADTSSAYVKSLIVDHFSGLEGNGLLYIVGHVPVPYSGNLYPDAHTNHIGAWPADVFYGDLDGTWTDASVNNVTASDTRNHNVPGDGKYDESELPSDVELMIGRADFANLPVFTEDEVELTRRYLQRTHEYKLGEWTLPKFALVDDNFGGFNGEAFAANGWRNFSPLIGKDNITPADYRSTMAIDGYLFSYGCGGGTFTSAGGIGNSAQLATDSLQTGFTLLFGSYFGDWDRSDNFLRSALAQGRTMSISWAGRPNWFYHSMATGHPIGYGARASQNNEFLYWASYGARFVHIAQLGDPSLRMEYLKPPTALLIDTINTFHVSMSWKASTESSVDGYFIYRKLDDNAFTRLNAEPVSGLKYIDSCAISSGIYTYLVKAVKVTENHSGSYWNESLGAEGFIEIIADKHADGVGYFQEDFGSSPLTGTFLVTYMNNWVSSVEWQTEGNTITGANVSYEPSGAFGTFFTYSSTFKNQCSELSTTQAIPLNIENISEQEVNIHPNPVINGGQVFIQGNSQLRFVHIYSMDGSLVFVAENQSIVNLPKNISTGVYMVEIATDSGKIYERLVIE
jgi:hypothetical protein